ncbi:DUF5007 domain-containing protein [Niabella ginsengisoli]|uniref:DUF5007 domain-containing protein n=1 Tax=Niabella ginsengisoli TaxID=522298 RepID=A0ABS9SG01_9BACT|nr:DUF5007 domain-containing protein [Niabella ginsengisoli]MCH5597286.1 DUF5007 domain-containing protein [Niabella ginsengisoli]
MNNYNKYMNRIFSRKAGYVLVLLVASALACKKYLPQERNTVGADSQFTIDLYEPYLGRTTYFTNNFFKGSTTYPADFKIINVRRVTGETANELTEAFPVKVWKKAYDGSESSLAEIEAKRVTEYHPILEMSPHTGNITFWSSGRSEFILPQPDSGYLFDVELSNSGGRRFYRNLKVKPLRESPTIPSNLDIYTGQPVRENFGISVIANVVGAKDDRRFLGSGDVDVYIRKVEPSVGNTITFRFLDTLFNPLNPSIFSETDWENLVHGFNMQKTATYVKYDVAYPIPLANIPTKYTTTDGATAAVRFKYSRIGFGGARINSQFGLNFGIFEPGDWEIIFAFKTDVPKTTDDL